MMTGTHEEYGGHGHLNRAAAIREGSVTGGTIKSIGGTTFVLATKQGELTVITDAGTNFHSSKGAKEAGFENLSLAALKVGQRVGVQGERQDDTTLFAERVHIPNP